MPPTLRHRAAVTTLLALAVTAGAACSGSTVPSGTAFCGRVQKQMSVLKGLNVVSSDPETTKQVLAAFEDVGEVAPAPVREAWTKVTELVEQAATTDLKTPEAAGKLAEQALAAQPDVTTIKTYVKDTCGFELT